MSLYSDYIRELGCGREIIEIENVAFVTYYVHTDLKECYIEDMYIRPRYRVKGMCFKMLGDVERIAKEKGCTVLSHSVVKKHKRADVVLLLSGKYGFVKLHEDETDIYFGKEIK